MEGYLKLLQVDSGSLAGTRVYYLIPMGGCQKCVMTSIEYSKTQLNNPGVIFILVSQTGKKTITIHYDGHELNANNVLTDGGGVAYRKQVIGSNITVYYNREGCLVREDISPGEFDKKFAYIKDIVGR